MEVLEGAIEAQDIPDIHVWDLDGNLLPLSPGPRSDTVVVTPEGVPDTNNCILAVRSFLLRAGLVTVAEAESIVTMQDVVDFVTERIRPYEDDNRI